MDHHFEAFFRTLGLPDPTVHWARDHFDFDRPARSILVVGPMGSGKTAFAAQIWRDSQVAMRKDADMPGCRLPDGADLRSVFFVRSRLDRRRFIGYPHDALPYRGGYERIGEAIADIGSSVELEELMVRHRDVGTWVIDEASFYDERIAYVIRRERERRGLVFVLPTLILNFRNALFNPTASLLLEHASDVVPLTAYCEHPRCLEHSNYTYRYYIVDERECPALYFDPLIIVGGDTRRSDGREPNYGTRCRAHHVLPGKDYTYLVLKPLGEAAARGETRELEAELRRMRHDVDSSLLAESVAEEYADDAERRAAAQAALAVPYLAERALVYLFAEQNLLGEPLLRELIERLDLDRGFLSERLADNRRPIAIPSEVPHGE